MDAPTITVTARRDGFRRAGRAWGTTPTTLPADELTEDQVRSLVEDPALVVVFASNDEDEPVNAVVTPENMASGLAETDGPAITVTARRDGFRRAGRAWGTTPTTLPADEFTEDQVRSLVEDPALVVVLSDGGPNTRGGADPDPGDETGSGEPDGKGADPGKGSSLSPGDPAAPQTVEDAIALIDPDDRSKWASGGPPRVDAIEAILDRDVTAAERDRAWAAVQGAA